MTSQRYVGLPVLTWPGDIGAASNTVTVGVTSNTVPIFMNVGQIS